MFGVELRGEPYAGPARTSNLRHAILAAMLSLCPLLVSGAHAATENGGELRQVEVLQIVTAAVEYGLEAHATVTPLQAIVLRSELPGTIIAIEAGFEDGRLVQQGDALVKLDPIPFELEVERARAGLARAVLELELEKAEARTVRRDRNQHLGDNDPGGVGTRELHVAYREAEVAAARAELRDAERKLDLTTLRAPFDAVISERQVNLGTRLMAGDPLARLEGIEMAEIRVPVEARHYPQINAAADRIRVQITAATGASRSGRLRGVAGVVAEHSNVMHVLVGFPDPYALQNEDQLPLPFGSHALVRLTAIPLDKGVILPAAALNGEQVLVVNGEDRIERRQVNPVHRDGEQVLISAGLRTGERVVLQANSGLQDGQRVAVRMVRDPAMDHAASGVGQ